MTKKENFRHRTFFHFPLQISNRSDAIFAEKFPFSLPTFLYTTYREIPSFDLLAFDITPALCLQNAHRLPSECTFRTDEKTEIKGIYEKKTSKVRVKRHACQFFFGRHVPSKRFDYFISLTFCFYVDLKLLCLFLNIHFVIFGICLPSIEENTLNKVR